MRKSWGEAGERREREKEREILETVSLARKRKREETDAWCLVWIKRSLSDGM